MSLIQSRVVLSLASLFLLLGVVAVSYAFPNVQGQSASGEKPFSSVMRNCKNTMRVWKR